MVPYPSATFDFQPLLTFTFQGYTPLGHLVILLVFIVSLVVIFALMWFFVSTTIQNKCNNVTENEFVSKISQVPQLP